MYLILNRLDYLKSEAQLESVVSRESSFLFNNLILLASCFAVLWGTLFPVISEAVTGEKISVDAPFFNRVNIPIGLFLMFLTGVGPLIAWRRSSFESLKRAFLWPAVAGLSCRWRTVRRWACRSIPTRWFRSDCACSSRPPSSSNSGKARARSAARADRTCCPPMVELTHRNTRRYGGYIVHMGIVFMFIGFTGSAFNQNKTAEVPQGGTVKIGSLHAPRGGLRRG